MSFLHVEGDSSGAVGTGGHSFSLPTSVKNCPYNRVKTGYSYGTIHWVSLNGRTVKVECKSPTSANTLYINADFAW